MLELTSYQAAAIYSPYEHMAMIGGVAIGKTFTGSNFTVNNLVEYPHLSGLVGANTYDQLSQVSIKELLYWFDKRGVEHVVDIWPKHWEPKRFKTYRNIITTRVKGQIQHIFTRVLSDPDALRGLEFSWYWIDETRDTPHNTHDIILSRLRESDIRRGLVTTTPSGDDWVKERFVDRKGIPDPRLYGSMHVKTIESVKAGLIQRSFYDMLRGTYSPLLAAQELDAEHVNPYTGLAYYSTGSWNRRKRFWDGELTPDSHRPLIIGCDFNYDPAPHIWMIGQLDRTGTRIHWFDEIAQQRADSEQMAMTLAIRYGTFFLHVFGDRSGAHATTSAGEADYDVIARTLAKMGVQYTIDSDQGQNPRVRDRVENMNRLLKSATGIVSLSYDPERCPHLDADFRLVGWKISDAVRKPRLSAGDVQRTHASDGAGYACWKVLPPPRIAVIGESVRSQTAQIMGERE